MSEIQLTQKELFKLRTPEELKQVLEAVNLLVEEVTFKLDSEGLTIRTLDPSHVAMLDISWPSSGFDMYNVTDKVLFGVKPSEFLKILKNFNPKEPISVRIDNIDTLIVQGYEEKIKMRLIDSMDSNTPFPKLTFNSEFNLTKKALEKIKKLTVVSEYVTMESGRMIGVKMIGKGDSGEYELTFENGSEGVQEINVKEESKATYSLNYLLPFVQFAARNLDKYEGLTFEYSGKMPIRMTHRFNGGKIYYYLAPRVQD